MWIKYKGLLANAESHDAIFLDEEKLSIQFVKNGESSGVFSFNNKTSLLSNFKLLSDGFKNGARYCVMVDK